MSMFPEASGMAEARIQLSIVYPDGEPTLGVLAAHLAQIDRALRDFLRHASGRAALGPRRGWPRLDESARIERATTNSPLEIVSAIVWGSPPISRRMLSRRSCAGTS